jgi:hypothetical protein
MNKQPMKTGGQVLREYGLSCALTFRRGATDVIPFYLQPYGIGVAQTSETMAGSSIHF